MSEGYREQRVGSIDATTAEQSMWSLMGAVGDSAAEHLPTLDYEAMRLIMALRTASDIIFYDIDATVRQEGTVSAPTLRVLHYLQVYETLELSDLTRMTGMSRASASNLVTAMGDQGLVERAPSPTDRRKLVITITPRGSQAFIDSYCVFNDREAFWAEGLDQQERDRLIALLGKLMDHRLGRGDYRTRN